jgi:phosphatidate cytidylyltransferase
MLAVYCVSHVPALPMLQIPSYEGENAKLVLYLIVVVRFSDVLQYVFGKTLGKRRIARRVGPNKAREGAIGGITAAGLIGALLWWATPLSPGSPPGLRSLSTWRDSPGGFGYLPTSATGESRISAA